MRTRRKSYKQYGLTKNDVKIILNNCKTKGAFIDENGINILMVAAVSSNAQIADQIYVSVLTGASYEKLTAKTYIPIAKADFYGYRRLCIYLYHELLKFYEIGGLKNNGLRVSEVRNVQAQ